jgi:hypothetical protein
MGSYHDLNRRDKPLIRSIVQYAALFLFLIGGYESCRTRMNTDMHGSSYPICVHPCLSVSNKRSFIAFDDAGCGRVTHALQWTSALGFISSVMILEANVEMLSSIESAINARLTRKRTFRLICYSSNSCHHLITSKQYIQITRIRFHQMERHCQGKRFRVQG